MQTDRTIPKIQPDIIISENEKGTCMLIDVVIPGGRNVIKKLIKKWTNVIEKILKCKD
jgi:hypothetical protein